MIVRAEISQLQNDNMFFNIDYEQYRRLGIWTTSMAYNLIFKKNRTLWFVQFFNKQLMENYIEENKHDIEIIYKEER